MDQDFDVDVTFEESANESLIGSLSKADLKKKCDSLPHELVEAAMAILVDSWLQEHLAAPLLGHLSQKSAGPTFGLKNPGLFQTVHGSNFTTTNGCCQPASKKLHATLFPHKLLLLIKL